MRCQSVPLALLLVAGTGLIASAQRPRASPVEPLSIEPQQPERKAPQPFRAAVTRVEVSALVLDRDGKPVRGLTAADFDVFEDGAPQIVRSFTPFTYEPDLIVLPDPVRPSAGRPDAATATPASNYYASSSRVFALILDDLHVDVRRTQVARAAAHRLIDQLGPADLLFVTTSSSAESTGYFSRDRQHALAMIDGFMGQRIPDQTMALLRFGGHDFEAERLDHYERLCATIRNVSLAFRDIAGRRKTVILLSEGSSFGANLSDMTVRMPTPTSGGRANVPTGASRAMNEALAAAAVGNVAIYPLNPAGLDTADADLVQVPGLRDTALTEDRYSAILGEARQAKEMARDLAAMTGGVSLVDSNDALAGIDRAVRDASVHYVLSYEPATAPKPSEYRRIEVKVRRPGLRVLARRGYSAAGPRQPPPMKVPDTLSPQLRTLLAGVMPGDGLAMRVQAMPLARSGSKATVAVIVEVNGASFPQASDGVGSLRVEQGLLTVNASGKATNGMRRTFEVSLTPTQREVLGATGLRSVWAIELPSGRHQVRVGTVDAATGVGGSVYVDVNIPDGAALPPGMLLSSGLLSAMPTIFADERLSRWTTPTPTATRVFPAGDVLTVTVPHAGSAPASAQLSTASGEVVWSAAGTPIDGASAVQFVLPLDRMPSQVCDLTVHSGFGIVHTTIGIAAGDGR